MSTVKNKRVSKPEESTRIDPLPVWLRLLPMAKHLVEIERNSREERVQLLRKRIFSFHRTPSMIDTLTIQMLVLARLTE